MGSEPRTLCDIFVAAAASRKPNLLISKVGGVWKPIPASDFGFAVRALSLGLNGLGVQPGDRVAILSLNADSYLEYFYATPWAGALVVPLNTRLAAPELVAIINDAGAVALLVDETFAAMLPALMPGLTTVRTVAPSLEDAYIKVLARS